MNHSDGQLKLPEHLTQVNLEQDVVVGTACAFLLAGPTEAPTPSLWRTRIATRSRFSPVHVVFLAWMGDKPHGPRDECRDRAKSVAAGFVCLLWYFSSQQICRLMESGSNLERWCQCWLHFLVASTSQTYIAVISSSIGIGANNIRGASTITVASR